MNDNLLHIKRRVSSFPGPQSWVSTYGNDRMFCSSALEEHVDIPQDVDKMIVAFYPRAKSYGFKFKENTQHDAGPFIICGTKRVALYHALDNVFRKQLAQGNQYFRFEYR